MTDIVVAESSSMNPRQTLDFFEGKIVDSARDIPQDVWAQNELELSKNFRQTDVDFLLRKNLHKLVSDAQKSGLEGKITTTKIYEGICSRQHFYTNLMPNQYRIVWLLHPIQNYQDLLEEGLYFAIKRVRDELLTMPINEKTAGHILKALEFFANRALGPLIQKIESKNLNANLELNSTNQFSSPDQIKAKIKELEASMDKSAQIREVNVEAE